MTTEIMVTMLPRTAEDLMAAGILDPSKVVDK